MDWVPLAGGGVDLSQQVARWGDRSVHLTTKERDLLAYLVRNPGRTITRSELLVHVWGNPASGSEEPVYSTVKRLRAKIDGEAHRHIVGVHGDGYRWEPALAAPLPSSSAEARGRFFGRASELSAIDAAFSGGALLVTLVGPGGAGKTRCAVELAASRAHLFCDLSQASDHASAVSAVAAALGVPLDGAEPDDWMRGVGRALSAIPGRLLVLDNAEQAVDAVAAMVGAWLSSGATFLVTSREALAIRGETVVSIGALPIESGVLLLADRVADPNARHALALYSEVVERVDGLPLAIELCAVQVRALGPRALLDSLGSQLATLVSGARDAPPRHATMRAAVEGSWSFSSERERRALADLTVLAGSFDSAAARAIIGGPDSLAALAGLVRRSMVWRAGERFSLYSAVRELAIEKGGDRAHAADRHAEHFVRAAEASVVLLEGPSHREGAACLREALPELRAALAHTSGRQPEWAARLALTLERGLGLSGERASLRRRFLAEARAGVCDDLLRCRLLLAEGSVEGSPFDLLDEALELARGTALEPEVVLARCARLATTDPAFATDELERALALVGPLSSAGTGPRVKGRILALLGEIGWSLGLVHEASTRLRSALAIHVEVEDRRAIARSSALLAHVDRVESGGGAARALLDQAIAAADELGDPVVAARVQLDLGQHLTRIGDQDGARAALDLASRSYERLGLARDRAFVHLHVAETLVGTGEHDAALTEALAAWSALPADVGRSTVHEAIACIQMLRGDLGEAQRFIETGLELARANRASRSECTLLGKRGLIRLARGDFEGARADFDEATTMNETRGSVAITAASLGDRAMAAFAVGDDDAALRDLARAREMLHHPGEENGQGRMLAASEPVGRGFGALRLGTPRALAHATARAATARFFRLRPQEWDVSLRLLDWLIDRIASCPVTSAG